MGLICGTSIVTAVGNDYGYEAVFERQVSGLGQTGDILVAISTSGNSENVLRAIQVAHERDMVVIALTGNDSGKIASALASTDIHLCLPHHHTLRSHALHIADSHAIAHGT